MTSRDGIAGYWRGVEGLSAIDNATPGGWDAFRRMAAGPRAAVLDHETSGIATLALAGTGAEVALAGGGGPLVTLTRPDFERDDDGDGLSDFLVDQMPHLRDYADLRDDRLAEIQTQQVELMSFFGALTHLDGEAFRRTLELMGALLRWVVVIEMRLKMHFDLPRPITTTPKLQPVIQTPGHGSWPSGHATEAFAMAHLLGTLHALGRREPAPAPEQALGAAGQAASQHMRLAERIAVNRTVAGVHYPSDSMAGAVLGLALGEAMVAYLRAGEGVKPGGTAAAAKVPARAFDGSAFTGDFDIPRLRDEIVSAGSAALPDRPLGVLDTLWTWAREEWERP